ncbi:hypothetical protein M407DRAFT_36389, partial [Tulasnella calospora MUT 4182]
KEVQIWTGLQHPNVAPLYGFTFGEQLCAISPWFNNGRIDRYIQANPDVDRMSLIIQVAEGMAYLHRLKPCVVHGDLKPDNVLIDKDGNPRLIDFGLSKLIEEPPDNSVSSSGSLDGVCNHRWVAPEIFLNGTGRSCRSDVFSFGCLAFYIYTDQKPFMEIPDNQVGINRIKGAYP